MSIAEIISKRDEISLEEAQELVDETKEEIADAIACGDYTLVEDIVAGNLGLEMDYIFELI